MGCLRAENELYLAGKVKTNDHSAYLRFLYAVIGPVSFGEMPMLHFCQVI